MYILITPIAELLYCVLIGLLVAVSGSLFILWCTKKENKSKQKSKDAQQETENIEPDDTHINQDFKVIHGNGRKVS